MELAWREDLGNGIEMKAVDGSCGEKWRKFKEKSEMIVGVRVMSNVCVLGAARWIKMGKRRIGCERLCFEKSRVEKDEKIAERKGGTYEKEVGLLTQSSHSLL